MNLIHNRSFVVFLFLSFVATAEAEQRINGHLSPTEIKEKMLHPYADTESEKIRRIMPFQEVPLDNLIGKEVMRRLRAKKALKGEHHSLRVGDWRAIQERRGVDLRYKDTPIKDQRRFLSNQAMGPLFALIAVLENEIGGTSFRDLSERHLWQYVQDFNIHKIMATAEGKYLTEEAYWPTEAVSAKVGHMNHAHTRFISSTYLGDNLDEMVGHLDQEKPVFLVFSHPKDLTLCKSVVTSMLSSGKGHAVAVVGYQIDADLPGGGYFIVKNSYGVDCGDKGYHYIPFSYCQKFNNYCLMYTLDEIETAFPLDDTQEPFFAVQEDPEAFYPNDVFLSVRVANQVASLSLDLPEEEKRQIKSVVYKIDDTKIQSKKMKNHSENFKWSFSWEGSSFDVTYTITLLNGVEFELNHSFSY